MILNKVYPKRIGPLALTGSAVLYFTADKRYGIESWMLSNITGTDESATIHIVPASASPTDANKILGGVVVPSNDQTTIKMPIILEVGDKVYALASTGASLNLIFNVNDVEIQTQ